MVPSLVYMSDANNPDGTVANLEQRRQPAPLRPDQPGTHRSGLHQRLRAARRALVRRRQRAQSDASPHTVRVPEQQRALEDGLPRRQQGRRAARACRSRSSTSTARPGGAEAKPLWLDIDGCGDSEYTVPVGYSDTTANWVSTVSGRMIAMGGHLHDLDITNSAPCTNHCPEKGDGIAVSAEIVGGNANDYYGPIPPNNPPPASLTGATVCRSEGIYGTPWAGTTFRGHLDTMTQCGISTSLLPTHQAEAWPAGGEFPVDRLPVQRRADHPAAQRVPEQHGRATDRRDGNHDGLVRPHVDGLPARQRPRVP